MKTNVTKATKPIAQVSAEQAQKIIDEKNEADRVACVAEINKIEAEIIKPILDKYGFVKVIQGRFAGGQIQTEIVLMKK